MNLKAGEEAYRSTFYVLRNLVIAIQKIRVLCKMGLKTNIQAIEDGVLTAIEKDRCLTPVTSSYLYIRRTAGYASDIAEIALKETIDEVTEKHSATRRRP